MAMICASGAASLGLGYRSFLELLDGKWQDGLILAILGIGCVFATILLCRNRNDLLMGEPARTPTRL